MEGRIWRNFDLILYGAAVALALIGVAMVYSATRVSAADSQYLDTPPGRQLIFAVVGLALGLVMARLDYRLLGVAVPILYGGAVLLLLVVLLLGEVMYGSRRQFELSFLSVRPSELAKLLVIIVLAKYLADHQEQVRRLKVLGLSLLLAALPAALVFFQPDLGTMILFGAIWLGMVIMAGVRWLHLGMLALGAGLAAPLAYFVFFHEYMRDRLASFLDPAGDPLGMGYNILQSEISVGSGGIWGKGFTQGTQSQLHFLRVQPTDFIFSVVGEELGFVGSAILLVLFAVLLLRGVRAIALSRDVFGRLLATGIITMILVQVFINIGVNVRLLPVTGIPLPLISYGGSSLFTVFMALGILESILLRHKRIEF